MLDALIKALPAGWQLGVILGILGAHMLIMWKRTNEANAHLGEIAKAASVLNTPDPASPNTPRVIALMERTEESVEQLHTKLDHLSAQLTHYRRDN